MYKKNHQLIFKCFLVFASGNNYLKIIQENEVQEYIGDLDAIINKNIITITNNNIKIAEFNLKKLKVLYESFDGNVINICYNNVVMEFQTR